MNKSKIIKLLGLVVIVGTVLSVSLGLWLWPIYKQNGYCFICTAPLLQEGKEQKIESIMQEPDFQVKAHGEAERIYYQRQLDEAQKQLLDLKKSGFDGQTVSKVEKILGEYDASLASHAYEIVQLPRWEEVLAIAGAETTFCQKGVGESKNNCGALMGADGHFKSFTSKLEGIQAISKLLSTRYEGVTIAELNGVYCVDSSQPDNKCVGWVENVSHFMSKFES